jgi:hypothetical protein
MTGQLDDALKGFTRRQLEDLGAKIAKELRTCTLCGAEGAQAYRVRPRSHGAGTQAAMLFCKPCFEKHRVYPEGRAAGTT